MLWAPEGCRYGCKPSHYGRGLRKEQRWPHLEKSGGRCGVGKELLCSSQGEKQLMHLLNHVYFSRDLCLFVYTHMYLWTNFSFKPLFQLVFIIKGMCGGLNWVVAHFILTKTERAKTPEGERVVCCGALCYRCSHPCSGLLALQWQSHIWRKLRTQ